MSVWGPLEQALYAPVTPLHFPSQSSCHPWISTNAMKSGLRTLRIVAQTDCED
jgi:hypothetical protein